jgi:limonene-1,2-epoxide hydrolase
MTATTTSTDPRTVAETYFRSWKDKDFDTLRSILHDGVTFRGPLGKADGADECIAGLKGMAESITDLRTLKIAVDGNDVITWYDLYTEAAPPIPTANWSHVEDGLITRIRATFDPRPLLADS